MGPVAVSVDQQRRRNRGVGIVLPSYETWRSRRGFPLTYRMTQVLTRHSVFG